MDNVCKNVDVISLNIEPKAGVQVVDAIIESIIIALTNSTPAKLYHNGKPYNIVPAEIIKFIMDKNGTTKS